MRGGGGGIDEWQWSLVWVARWNRGLVYGGMLVNVVYEVVVVAIVIDLGGYGIEDQNTKAKNGGKGKESATKRSTRLRIDLQTSHLRFRLQKSSFYLTPAMC